MRLPRTIAGYEFLELLGAGNFGAVYRCRLRGELGFDQEVAIKVLDAARADMDRDLIASLANEARILSRVQHPNIVQARHFIKLDDEALGETHALVLELVRGQPLRKLMTADARAEQPLPIFAPLQVMSEISDALHFAHKLKDDAGNPVGLVHRDLKPDNIHVSNEGRIKVLDFGIAWAKHRLGRTTAGGRTKGTPLYMSPEQLRGEKLDARSDLYSLGLVGFEMLAGEPYVPIEGNEQWRKDPLGAALAVNLRDRIPVLEAALTRRYDLSPTSPAARELVALVRQLLAWDAVDRPAKGGDVFDQLEALSTLHRPTRGRYHLRHWVEDCNAREAGLTSEDRAPTGVASTLILAAPDVPTEQLTATGPAAVPTPDEPLTIHAPAVRSARNRWLPWALFFAALAAAVIGWFR